MITKSFHCTRCRRRIHYSGSRYDAVHRHYWKHHKRVMMKNRRKKRR